MAYLPQELSGLGWSDVQLSEVRGLVLSRDSEPASPPQEHCSPPFSSPKLRIETRESARKPARARHTAFSIGSVEADPLLAGRATVGGHSRLEGYLRE
jgi:hypothetical protein